MYLRADGLSFCPHRQPAQLYLEDVLEKALRYEGYPVTRVMNITDVGHLSGTPIPARTRC